MRIFLDSSALAKRYIKEKGTEKVNNICKNSEAVIISALCLPEVLSAGNRLIREGTLNQKNYYSIKTELVLDMKDSIIINITPDVIKTVIMCLERRSIRTLDAIHIASAIEAKCDLFVSADHRQCLMAKLMNLRIKEC